MAHQAVETRLAQPASEGTDAKSHKETDHTLREFWRSTITLRNVLDQGRSLNDLELRLLENQLHVLQKAYLGTKQKQRGLPMESPGSPPLNHGARSGPILQR
jgi:hypothetical protein